MILLVPSSVRGSYQAAVGWDQLVAELGDAVPLGRGVQVSLIESADFLNRYQPDTSNYEFSGKALVAKSRASGDSDHATVVGQLLFGTHSSMARAIDTIHVYHADDWLLSDFLGTGESAAPAVETSRIQNHSWVGTFTDDHKFNVEAVRRLDYAIERDGFVAVVALSNDTTAVRPLLAHSYNAISVGRPDGQHSRDGTWFEGEGRVRPDLVTPGGFFTSYSTPVVSSAVAVLLEAAEGDSRFENVNSKSAVMKAILMAGANKSPFPDWGRSDERPLDPVVGAGQLNVYHSYQVLVAGEHGPGEATNPERGWHLGMAVSGETKPYFLSVDREQETFTAHLTWNRLIEPGEGEDFLDAAIVLPRLECRLVKRNGVDLENELQVSVDPVNNSQHIFVRDLPPGDYALVIERVDEAEDEGIEYALAWDGVAAPSAGFVAWQETFFSDEELENSDDAKPKSDPDGDGLANLLEYALGSDPRAGTRHASVQRGIFSEEGKDYLTLTVTRARQLDDVSLGVDLSSDLKTWTKGGAILIASEDASEGRVTETFRDVEPIASGVSRFLRLTVSLDAP